MARDRSPHSMSILFASIRYGIYEVPLSSPGKTEAKRRR